MLVLLFPSTTPADAKKEGRRAAAQLSFIIDRAMEAVIVEDHHEERRSLRITNESASKEYICMYQHYSMAVGIICTDGKRECREFNAEGFSSLIYIHPSS